MFVSPIWQVHHILLQSSWPPSWKTAATLGFWIFCDTFLVKPLMKNATTKFHACITNLTCTYPYSDWSSGHLEKRPPSWNSNRLGIPPYRVAHRDCSCLFSCLYHQSNGYISYSFTGSAAILKNGHHFEISIVSVNLLTEWPIENVHADFHVCITNLTGTLPTFSMETAVILKNGGHFEISVRSDTSLVKWSKRNVHANFHAFITKLTGTYRCVPPKCQPSWKTAAILKFWLEPPRFSQSIPWRMFMPIFMLVSPNARLWLKSAVICSTNSTN